MWRFTNYFTSHRKLPTTRIYRLFLYNGLSSASVGQHDNFPNSNKSVAASDQSDRTPSTHVSQTVKQAAKDLGYSTIIFGGVALTGVILYLIFHELFSKKSPNGVYNKAFKVCKNDVRVQDLLGSSIKAHGEENRRGRRRHTAHTSWYDTEGKLHMVMKFHLVGNLDSADVHLEVLENEHNDFEYHYLVVEANSGFSKKRVVIYPASPSAMAPSLP